MKRNHLLPMLLFFSLTLSSLPAQKSIFGITGGLTYSDLSAQMTAEGGVTDKIANGVWLKSLPGYHAGLYIEYPLGHRVLLRGEVGYELLRVKSLLREFNVGRIHHQKGGLLIGIRPVKWWTISGGLEGVRRHSEVTNASVSAPGLNGEDVSGFFWQGIVGTNIEIREYFQIGLRMTVPRIASLTRQYLTINNKVEGLQVEQLRAFQLVLGIPVYSGGFRKIPSF